MSGSFWTVLGMSGGVGGGVGTEHHLPNGWVNMGVMCFLGSLQLSCELAREMVLILCRYKTHYLTQQNHIFTVYVAAQRSTYNKHTQSFALHRFDGCSGEGSCKELQYFIHWTINTV